MFSRLLFFSGRLKAHTFSLSFLPDFWLSIWTMRCLLIVTPSSFALNTPPPRHLSAFLTFLLLSPPLSPVYHLPFLLPEVPSGFGQFDNIFADPSFSFWMSSFGVSHPCTLLEIFPSHEPPRRLSLVRPFVPGHPLSVFTPVPYFFSSICLVANGSPLPVFSPP